MSENKEILNYTKEDYIRAMQITLQKYNRKWLEKALIKLFKNDNPNGFTRDDNSRKTFEQDIEKSKIELIKIWLEYSQENFSQILRKQKKELPTIKEICKLISQNVPSNELLPKGAVTSIQERDSNMKKSQIMAKLNGCDGLDYTYPQSKSIGNMQLASSQGKRPSQEDAGLIMQHPELPDFKMLVVADGMGILANGELASNYLIDEIQKWFQTLPREYYYSANDTQLKQDLKNIISEISKHIYKEYKKAGSTFISAIVRNEDIKIASVGDSIAYGFKNGNIRQLNKDDNAISMLYDMGDLPEIKNRDDIRFHKNSNYVANAIGGSDSNFKLHFTSAPKDETIILCSNGVSDCLSMKFNEDSRDDSKHTLKDIILKTDKETLAEKIVRRATDGTKSKRPNYLKALSDIYYNEILRGKDNATAAVYTPDKDR